MHYVCQQHPQGVCVTVPVQCPTSSLHKHCSLCLPGAANRCAFLCAARRQAAQLMQRLAAAAEGACRVGEAGSNGAGPAAPLVLLAGDFNTTPDAAACRVRAEGSWVCRSHAVSQHMRCCWCL